MSDRAARVASRYLLAMKFPTQEAMDAYLKKWPKADRSKHWVEKSDKSEKKSEKPAPKVKPKAEAKPEPKKEDKPVKEQEKSTAKKVKKSDVDDAIGVMKEWASNTSKYRFDPATIEKYFKDALDKKPEKLDLSKVDIFADHGRRVSDSNLDNTIIALKMPDGRYKALDGQHRVLTRKDKKLEDVNAVVIEVPWKSGAKRNGFSSYYIDDKS